MIICWSSFCYKFCENKFQINSGFWINSGQNISWKSVFRTISGHSTWTFPGQLFRQIFQTISRHLFFIGHFTISLNFPVIFANFFLSSHLNEGFSVEVFPHDLERYWSYMTYSCYCFSCNYKLKKNCEIKSDTVYVNKKKFK